MVAMKIEDIRQFTTKLFLREVFDRFLVREAVIVTFNTFRMDGHIRKGYYTREELEEHPVEKLSAWSVLRPVCFSLIRGKKLPESFQITLQLASEDVQQFLQNNQLAFTPEQIQGLYLNIRYEEGMLYCITGTSLQVFTLDKNLEEEWDRTAGVFLKKQEIFYTIE